MSSGRRRGCMGTQENPLSAAPLQVGLGEKVSGSDSLLEPRPLDVQLEAQPKEGPAQCSEPSTHTALGDENPSSASSLLSQGLQGSLFTALGLSFPCVKG